MPNSAAWSSALCIGLALSACNATDVVAHGAVTSGKLEDAAMPACDIAAQLARNKLPTGLANVFVDCEWPLRRSDNPDDLGVLLPERGDEEEPDADGTGRVACVGKPYRWWQEPPLPQPPQRIVYCAKACEAVKNWIRCKLRDDVCNAPRERTDQDAGTESERGGHSSALHCAD